MKKTILVLATLVSVVMLSACQNTVNTTENQEKKMIQNTITDKRVATDGYLRDRLALKQVDVAMAPGDIMRVQVTAVNMRVGFFSELWSGITGENPYKIMFRFTWYDDNGMVIENALSGWQEKTIYPGETVFFQSVAPNKRAKDFLLSLKETE